MTRHCRRFRHSAALAVAVGFALAGAAQAAQFDDPDWPCVQRKVPALSVGQMWAGPVPAEDAAPPEDVAALAQRLAPRRVAVEDAAARARSLVEGMGEDERAQTLGSLFAAVLGHINAERGEIIAGIGRYAHRQADLAARVEEKQLELARLEAAPEEQRDMDRIEELRDTLVWDTRVYKERAQSLTYVCETPVLLERRAFDFARALANLM